MGPLFNNQAVFKAGESQGKSGSFFFFSHDRKFLIKTMFQAELDVAMQKLQEYCEYISYNKEEGDPKSKQKSLIARIYGIYQVEMEGVVPISLLLMANTIQLTNKANPISKVFDLKGSWVNRFVTLGEK